MKSFLGLGSNLGDRRGNIERALERLNNCGLVKVTKTSSLYEADPIGGPPQGRYLNGAAEIDTAIPPRDLLYLLKAAEAAIGRKPSGVRWGPREIDVDILLFGSLIIDEPDLKVPHPLMHLRPFVLEPLCELSPFTVHPVLKKSVRDLLAELRATAGRKGF